MQKFELLYNLSFSANTELENFGPQDSQEPILYNTQQNVNLNQDYYSYTNRVGVSIVNDLNVKSFLDRPENEQLAINFIDYLKNLLTFDEFRDLFYDNKKLAEFFNDYYKKFIIHSNQGTGSTLNDPNINLLETKNELFNQDELYVKTNGLTGYYTNEVLPNNRTVPVNYNNPLLPTDSINFSGNSENYYLNITINKKNSLLNYDDFSEYFKDICDGSINYTKYLYKTSVYQNIIYGNLEQLQAIQESYNTLLGPDPNFVNYLQNLLPVNFLNATNNDSSGNLGQDPSRPYIVVEEGIYNDILTNQIVNIPQASDSNQINNFLSFNKFREWFGWYYRNYSPMFPNNDLGNENYIYQSVVDLTTKTNDLINLSASTNIPTIGSMGTSMSMSMQEPPSNVPNLIKCDFEFIQDPNWYSLNYIGQLYNPLQTNQLSISIKHNKTNIRDKVIVNYEFFSPSLIGSDDGVNSFNLGIPNNNDLSKSNYELFFDIGESVKTITINIYKDWGIRRPIVLSLRPFNNPNQICQYLIIYLEEFYNLSNYTYSEQLDVSNYNKCNLLFNGFVRENYNDNFLEYYKPDYLSFNYLNAIPNLISRDQFDPATELIVNTKLQNILKLSSVNLVNIAKKVGIPISSIYNIYVYGSYYFGTVNDLSDIDLIIVAEIKEPLINIKVDNVEYNFYSISGFEDELNNIVGTSFNTTYIPTDRAWQVYNTQSDNFKILERVKFNYNIDKDQIKTRQKQRADYYLVQAEKYFIAKDFTRYYKSLWSIFRGYDSAIELINNGKIIDIQKSNNILYEIKSKVFNDWQEVINYYGPKINDLYNRLLSL